MSAKWSLLLLLILVMGCEHTLGSAGFIGMALDKDMQAQGECDMPTDEWKRSCLNPSSEEVFVNDCPPECRPRKRPGR